MRLDRTVATSIRATMFGAALLLSAACGSSDSTTGVDPSTVAGDYRASSFTATIGTAETDVIAKGGSVTLSLLANGTASGHLVIPASVAGTAFDQTLNGTWAVSGNAVHLTDATTDTFLEDMSLTVTGSTLVGDDTFSGVKVHVVMTKLH